MPQRVTLKDIANKTGYTVNTISRALNNKSDISEQTKKYVREIADSMGYINDSMAGSLRSGKTKTIAVILSDIANPHLAHQVKLIELNAVEYGYNTIILNTDENSEHERRAIISAYEKRVDGILICPVQQNEDNIKFLQSINIPFVLIGRYFKNLEADAVLSDDIKAGYLATKHLIDKGFCKILFMSAPKYISSARERLEGYIKAHNEANISIHNELIHCTNVKSGNAKEIMDSIIENHINFDSVIAFSDMLAFEIKCVLMNVYGNEADTIPIIGFDGVQSHLPLPFKFTSIGMEKDGWAKEAVALLFNRIQNPNLPKEKIVRNVSLLNFDYVNDNDIIKSK